MIEMICLVFGVLTICLVIVKEFNAKSRLWLGIALGLTPIALLEIVLHGYQYFNIRDCLNSACASAGLPPGCEIAEFGCTEWSGLATFLFWAAGFAAVVLYAIGVILIVVISSRRRARTMNPESG